MGVGAGLYVVVKGSRSLSYLLVISFIYE